MLGLGFRFFMELGDYTTALEYLVMSKNYETAFEVARQNGQIQLFADILGDQASREDLNKIALHYEQERNFLLAGKYYALAGQNEKVISVSSYHILCIYSLTYLFAGFQIFPQRRSTRQR
jgi:hypothetical protein